MNPTSLSTIAQWAGGRLRSGESAPPVTRVCSDSRALTAGDLFVALRGDNFDGHRFVADCAGRGASAAIVDHIPDGMPASFPVIEVGDTLRALQEIASRYRGTLSLRPVVITGSNGKTSTKDFSAAVLSRRLRVTKTEGNLNNHIGLPLTLLRAGASDDAAVWEIGMNHPGEIAPLAKIAQPEVAVITNIGVAHLEFMGTRDAIAQEKGMLAEAVGPSGKVVLNAMDPYARSIAARTRATPVFAGIDCGDVLATNIETGPDGSEFDVRTNSDHARARLSVPGRHMIENAVLALAVGVVFGLSLDECVAGLDEARLTKGRVEQKIIRGIRIVDDTYNANPDSMRAALATLAALPTKGSRIAVLGKMGELGAESERGHREVGQAAAQAGINCLIGVGPEAALICAGAREGGLPKVLHVAAEEEAIQLLREVAQAGDIVLVKGSRSARMERIIEGMAAS